MRASIYIFGFLLLLIAPLTIHWLLGSAAPAPLGSSSAARLVIITSDDPDIRNEFRWAFADWHQQKYGQRVDVEYLSPGSTNDIWRQLDLTYREIRTHHAGNLPPEDQIDTGIDLVWGGGDYFFDHDLKPLGILRPIDLDVKTLSQIFPQPILTGIKLYDQDKDASGNPLPPKWVGTCLSSFGIVYNPDLFDAMRLPPPADWNDLANPKLAGALTLADPTHSATAALTDEVILQQNMARAESDFLNQPANRNVSREVLRASPDYQKALDAGWKRGMGELLLIAANARYFSDDARQLPTDVASGDAAAGMAIDFYGTVTQESVGPRRLRIVMPSATVVTPDPIAILYGTHGPQLVLANHFIEFLLTPQGQRLWILKPGQPGGPRLRALRRPPIRRDVYDDRAGWTDDVNYFNLTRDFALRPQWQTTYADLRTIWAAQWIDSRDQLRDAYEKILAISDESARQRLIDEFTDLPITREEVAALMARRIAAERDRSTDIDQSRARQRLELANRFRSHYSSLAREAEIAQIVD